MVQGSQAEGAWTAHAWRLMQRTEAAASLASLLNTLLFLKQGIYRRDYTRPMLIRTSLFYVMLHAHLP